MENDSGEFMDGDEEPSCDDVCLQRTALDNDIHQFRHRH